MTLRQGTSLGIRLLGLSMLLQFAANIPQTIVYLIDLSQNASASFGMPGVHGFYAALFSVAGHMAVGLALVGLTVVVLSAPALLAALADLRGSGRPDWYQEQNPANVQAEAFSLALRILLGAVLVRQAGAIAASVRKLWPGEEEDGRIFD